MFPIGIFRLVKLVLMLLAKCMSISGYSCFEDLFMVSGLTVSVKIPKGGPDNLEQNG